MTRFNSGDFPDIPLIELSNSFEIGYSVNADQADTENTWQYFDNASYLKGKHNMSFGGEMRRYQDNYFSNNRMRGQIDFISFQNFLLGQNGGPVANGRQRHGLLGRLHGQRGFRCIVQREDRIRDLGFFLFGQLEAHAARDHHRRHAL